MKHIYFFILVLPILLVPMSEGFFFEHPKKLLMDLFQSSKEKKEARKRPHIDHYHVHYYPVTIPIFEPLVKAPKKHKLEEIYHNQLETIGWSSHEYKYIPEPKIKTFSLYDSWKNSVPCKKEILETDLFEIMNNSEDENVLYIHPSTHKY
ncbi:uncharacterized protein LOC105680836 isoform X4 [Bombus impatiens]|uniref:Uncharacterized protein LOC117210875 isoform X3 n=2 Tax=Pyrobombus TaxID=144703 RepID=A0A6P8N6B8_9HYME|nr:uncharacterized protein LOC105680836 isoform X4 [Bombus impatiens]XP_033185675.1 uncharacterized protein LOC117154620 isoform X3 [Bombus vancouverensis nearcticus]XP_033310175.1 uncharacterized protein LOC117210875 isoform X3 [Bombus bifarius]